MHVGSRRILDEAARTGGCCTDGCIVDECIARLVVDMQHHPVRNDIAGAIAKNAVLHRCEREAEIDRHLPGRYDSYTERSSYGRLLQQDSFVGQVDRGKVQEHAGIRRAQPDMREQVAEALPRDLQLAASYRRRR